MKMLFHRQGAFFNREERSGALVSIAPAAIIYLAGFLPASVFSVVKFSLAAKKPKS